MKSGHMTLTTSRAARTFAAITQSSPWSDVVSSRSLLRSYSMLSVFVLDLASLYGCTAVKEIRVQHISTLDYADVSVADHKSKELST